MAGKLCATRRNERLAIEEAHIMKTRSFKVSLMDSALPSSPLNRGEQCMFKRVEVERDAECPICKAKFEGDVIRTSSCMSLTDASSGLFKSTPF